MDTSLIVVDDFLDNPDALRAAGLGLTYPDLVGPFPGRNSLQRLEVTGITEQVSRLTGERLRPLDPPLSHAKFRVSLSGDRGQGGVHVDPGYWSGILYLTRPEDCRGGTIFFRHRRTGTDRVPASAAELQRLGYASQDAMIKDLIGREGTDWSAWEQTMEVPMRYNRLVLLRPWLWHTAGPGFGTTPENGRLIYVMFFNASYGETAAPPARKPAGVVTSSIRTRSSG